MKLLNKPLSNKKKVYLSQKERQRYGIIVSLTSIIFNILLFLAKYIIGILSKSIAIQSDAFNNLSDTISNISTLIGFKFASKHADKDHPYGHGRSEYISGMIVSFFILLVAFESLRKSIHKIFNPEAITVSYYAVIILIIAMIIKLFMAYINNLIGKKIDSQSLNAAFKDSLNDVIVTFATFISLLLTPIISFPIDGYIGLLVSVFVLYSGISVFKDTSSPLIGESPKPKFVKEIMDFVMEFDGILGVHDLMIHDYGVTKKFITLHVEVSSDSNIVTIHNLVDEIERAMQSCFKASTTIHIDPINQNDPLCSSLKKEVSDLIKSININYIIQEFRIIKGKVQTKLIFDVVIPIDDLVDEAELKYLIEIKIKEKNEFYHPIINIEHQYIDLNY